MANDSHSSLNKTMNGKASQEQRDTINFRERCRMHALNGALDNLSKSLPYSEGTTTNMRKLTKIGILLLARNHIIMQANAIHELKQRIGHYEKRIREMKVLLQKKEVDDQ